MSEPTVKLLDSGYWHVRWNASLWFQWPAWRMPTLSDGFGWVTQKHLEAVVAAAHRR